MRRRTFLATTTVFVSSVVGTGRADTASFGPLGEVEIGRAMDAVPSADGRTAYVAATDGFATVDVGDPADPAVLTTRRGLLADESDGPLEAIWDLEGDGDRLIVAGPAHGSSPPLAGFLLFDVSDPADPIRLAFFETDYPIHNLAFVDGVAYLTGNDGAGNPLVAVDCSDDDPVEVGRWSLLDYDERWSEVPAFLRTLHDVWVQDGTAYLAQWDAGTLIVDVDDPSSMSVVAQVRGRSIETLAAMSQDESHREYIETPGNDHFVTVDENASLLGIGAEAWDDTATEAVGGPGGIELYDVSTPTEPRHVASITPPETPDPTYYRGVWTTAHNFDLTGGRLYAAWYRGGLTVHDVSTPEDPVLRATWADRDRASLFTAMVADDCVIASSIADPAGAPTTEGLFTFPIPEYGVRSRTTEPPATTSTTARPSSTTTESATESGGETTESEIAGETTESPSGQGAGFGVVSTLSALAAGGWYAFRRSRRES